MFFTEEDTTMTEGREARTIVMLAQRRKRGHDAGWGIHGVRLPSYLHGSGRRARRCCAREVCFLSLSGIPGGQMTAHRN